MCFFGSSVGPDGGGPLPCCFSLLEACMSVVGPDAASHVFLLALGALTIDACGLFECLQISYRMTVAICLLRFFCHWCTSKCT